MDRSHLVCSRIQTRNVFCTTAGMLLQTMLDWRVEHCNVVWFVDDVRVSSPVQCLSWYCEPLRYASYGFVRCGFSLHATWARVGTAVLNADLWNAGVARTIILSSCLLAHAGCHICTLNWQRILRLPHSLKTLCLACTGQGHTTIKKGMQADESGPRRGPSSVQSSRYRYG